MFNSNCSLGIACRRLSVVAAISLFGGGADASTFGLEAGYPGLPPGAARIECRGQEIAVGNAAIRLSWTATPQGLKPLGVRDERAGRTVEPGGEVFQIFSADDHRFAASEMPPEGKPRVSELAPEPHAAQLAARIAGRQVEVALASSDGRLRVLWRAFVRDGANYVRQEIEITARQDCTLRKIAWMDAMFPGAAAAGEVDGSPRVAGNLFLGPEDPHARGFTPCEVSLAKGETLTRSFVVGVAPPGQLRRAFLYYLERERACPYRPFLHYNSWYDISFAPFALNEKNCLEAIAAVGDNMVRRHGVVVDGMVFDDGWDDPHTLWHFHRGFPRGFMPLAESCRQYGMRLGTWLSPFGGYGEPKQQRLAFGRHRATRPTRGLFHGGPKYYAAFKKRAWA